MVLRRRYYFWLLRAYLKRWKKTVLLSLLLGVALFSAFFLTFTTYLQPIFEKKVEKIGYWGTFEPEMMPDDILNDISHGLTSIDDAYQVSASASSKWEILDNGKRYVFHITPKQFFHNKRELTTDNFPLEFKDVEKNDIDKYTVEFRLKSPYAPFLTTVSRPLFIQGLIGLGEYKVSDIELNAGLVKSISLQKAEDSRIRKTILFYPTESALKMGFMLGEIDRAESLSSVRLDDKDFSVWKNIEIERSTDHTELVTIFYNNNDNNLSDKKLRQALNYALSSQYEYGERAFSPIPKSSIYYHVPETNSVVDQELAKTFLESAQIKPGSLKLEISTTKDYEEIALKVVEEWNQIGVKTNIKIVDSIPDNFQVFIYSFKVPMDPDQYTLWHSAQKNNITGYKNLRIDKLLEDGRVITDFEERKKIYQDFQKYLLDDVPASFLYFPYKYSISRK